MHLPIRVLRGGVILTCGHSDTTYPNNYSLYFYTENIGPNTSRIPSLYVDSVSVDGSGYYYYCIEI